MGYTFEIGDWVQSDRLVGIIRGRNTFRGKVFYAVEWETRDGKPYENARFGTVVPRPEHELEPYGPPPVTHTFGGVVFEEVGEQTLDGEVVWHLHPGDVPLCSYPHAATYGPVMVLRPVAVEGTSA